MTPNSPKISVVIPCYNGARFLPETLASALGQTYPPHEITVIDDGSTDDSAAIAGSFGPPVRVIRQPNQGESVARNRGIDEAKGNWIAFLDADDVWKPTKLERQVQAIGEGVVCVHTNFFRFGARNSVGDFSKVPPETRYSIEHISTSSPMHISSMMVRKDVDVRFPAWTRYAEDMVYCLDLSLRGKICLVDEVLTGYRYHSASQSASAKTRMNWHKTIEKWLSQQDGKVSIDQIERIREHWNNVLLETGIGAYYKRDWEAFGEIKEYMRSIPGGPDVERELPRALYPKIVYAMWDKMRNLVRRDAVGPAPV